MTTVITHARWGLDAARIEELKAHGVAIHPDEPLKGVPLPPLAYGEEQVGEVTLEEAQIFRAMWDIKNYIERVDRTIQADAMRAMASAVETHEQESVVILSQDEIAETLNADERLPYWKGRQTAGYLHALFHYALGERLGLHHCVLGLRAGGAVVKLNER